MLTRAAFLTSWPEFSETDVATVDAKLAEAELQIDADVWGALVDVGHGYLAAHLLASSPFGNGARLEVGGLPTTTYGLEFARLQRMAAAGIRSI